MVVLSETEVIKNSLKKFSFAKNEKFVQEVLWRIYWKGWLELRPMVWSDYIIELKKLKKDFYNNKNYLNAIEGKTNIECFNYWISEIKKNIIIFIIMQGCGSQVFGYLHLIFHGN